MPQEKNVTLEIGPNEEYWSHHHSILERAASEWGFSRK